MPYDKEGNKLTWAEWRERFRGGIEDITPMQQTKISLMGASIVVFGVVFGLIVTFGNIWWLFSILLGSLLLTGVTLLSLIQKYIGLKKINKAMEELNEQQESSDGI